MKNEPTAKRHEAFWPYALFGGVLLVVLTLAILTPDYLNHQYRRERLLKQQPSSAAVQSTPNPSGTSSAATNQPANTPEPNANGDSPKAADIYDTYAKLVTMMLGFVSVVGVLAGYFVRKSVRELTEDVRDEVEREVKVFERQRTDALEKVKDAEDATKKALNEAAKIKAEFEELLKKVAVNLKTLDEIAESRRAQKKSLLGSSSETSSQVDAQLGDIS